MIVEIKLESSQDKHICNCYLVRLRSLHKPREREIAYIPSFFQEKF